MDKLKSFFSCSSCYPPPLLSVSIILLFLARPWLHAGSRDLLLYQHRARCTLGASCLPFIRTGYRDVGFCLCVCVSTGHGGRSYFFGVPDWARAAYALRIARMWICEYVCACALASSRLCEQRDQIPSLSRGTRGACHFKGPWGSAMPACPPTGEILFMRRGLPWQEPWLTPEPGACTGCHHPCRFKSWTTLWSRNPASSLFPSQHIRIREDNIPRGTLTRDLKLVQEKSKHGFE